VNICLQYSNKKENQKRIKYPIQTPGSFFVAIKKSEVEK
jgi:hypothetical protein